MTRRGTALVLVAAALVAASARFTSLLPVALALLAAAALLVIVDSRRAPRGSNFRVERSVDQILSVGAANQVVIVVEANDRRAHDITIADAVPASLAADRQPQHLRVPGQLSYVVTPRARGEATFGQITLRVEGPLGLGFRQSSVGDPAAVKVDADISALGRYDALVRRGHLADMGVRTVRRRSEGTEFDRIREAVPDDPLRSINWRATARAGRLMATDYVPERSQPVVICLDHGRLMGVGAGDLTKLDCAINAAVLLAHAALQSGDRVGVFGFADTVDVTLKPAGGRAQLRRILNALQPAHPLPVEPDYDDALGQLSRWHPRRALLLIFTDVIDPDQGQALIRQCLRLRRRHLPLVITVRDPALDDVARAVPTTAITVYERAIANGLLNDREAALDRLRASGIDTLDADARTLSPRLVSRYLDIKRTARL